jgi:Skp family chaperone for outer membrane proteins
MLLVGVPANAQQADDEGVDAAPQVYEGAADMSVDRIGLIDLDGVLRASEGAARVRDLLDEQRRGFQREFATREAALQETERKLVANRDDLDEAEFSRQLAEFEASVTQIQKEIQFRREAIDVAFQEAQSRLRNLAIQIVTELAQEKKLDLVLVRESALIFLPSLNLSDEVLRRLDERTRDARIEVTVSPVGTDE